MLAIDKFRLLMQEHKAGVVIDVLEMQRLLALVNLQAHMDSKKNSLRP